MTALEELKEKLVKEWDDADMKTLENITSDWERIAKAEGTMEAYQRLNAKYKSSELNLRSMGPQDIHEANEKAADRIIKNLEARVEKKIGKITNATHVYTSYDNEGFVILNGYFTGENGRCEVESIRAGGWNIQKRHIRVLVK